MGLFKLQRTAHWLPPAIALIASAALLVGGEVAREGWRYDRTAVENWEFWRLLSGHFVHLGWSHFALNGAGLLLVWYLIGRRFGNRDWAVIALASMATMDLGFWFLNPGLQWYVGLSGLLHGVLAAGLVASAHERSSETILLALLLVAKLAWEQFSGPLPGSESTSGGAVIVDAHLYGAIGGIIGVLLAKIRVRRATPI